MDNSFLPEGYSAPQGGNSGYMKLEDGENRVRVLAKPIMGMELWIGNKPQRRRMGVDFTKEELASADMNQFTGKKKVPQHFWAMTVWNYKTNSIQILQINQSTIQRAIVTLYEDADWGAPYGYDLVIKKTGEGRETEYSVTPKPHKELSDEAKEAKENMQVNLEALYEGGNPFGSSSSSVNPEDAVSDEPNFVE